MGRRPESKAFDWTLVAGVNALVALHLVGCGSEVPTAVSGRITLNGKPLSEAVIMFVPLDQGHKKTGGEVNDGNYSVSSDVGLMPGRYRVEVADNPPLNRPPQDRQGKRSGPTGRRLLPARYSQNSPLAIEVVPGGSAVFDFELQNDPGKN